MVQRGKLLTDWVAVNEFDAICGSANSSQMQYVMIFFMLKMRVDIFNCLGQINKL